MKTFTTLLIVILTVVLGRWLITFDSFLGGLSMNLYSMFFIGVFSYGVYKILEQLENDN